MRVGILLNLFSTGCPSCMTDSQMGLSYVFGNFVNKSFDAVEFFICLFSMLDHVDLDLSIIIREGDNACTIITPILEELDSHGEGRSYVLPFIREYPNYAATLGLFILLTQEESSKEACCCQYCSLHLYIMGSNKQNLKTSKQTEKQLKSVAGVYIEVLVLFSRNFPKIFTTKQETILDLKCEKDKKSSVLLK